PSGCGKSTTLRMVAGLVTPTAGRVEIRGQPVTRPIRDVGMVFQSPVLLPWRTTLANVLFTAEMAGDRARAHRPRALELIRLAGRPGTARAIIPVDLPRPRDAKTLSDARFVELAAAVRDNIEAQWVE